MATITIPGINLDTAAALNDDNVPEVVKNYVKAVTDYKDARGFTYTASENKDKVVLDLIAEGNSLQDRNDGSLELLTQNFARDTQILNNLREQLATEHADDITPFDVDKVMRGKVQDLDVINTRITTVQREVLLEQGITIVRPDDAERYENAVRVRVEGMLASSDGAAAQLDDQDRINEAALKYRDVLIEENQMNGMSPENVSKTIADFFKTNSGRTTQDVIENLKNSTREHKGASDDLRDEQLLYRRALIEEETLSGIGLEKAKADAKAGVSNYIDMLRTADPNITTEDMTDKFRDAEKLHAGLANDLRDAISDNRTQRLDEAAALGKPLTREAAEKEVKKEIEELRKKDSDISAQEITAYLNDSSATLKKSTDDLNEAKTVYVHALTEENKAYFMGQQEAESAAKSALEDVLKSSSGDPANIADNLRKSAAEHDAFKVAIIADTDKIMEENRARDIDLSPQEALKKAQDEVKLLREQNPGISASDLVANLKANSLDHAITTDNINANKHKLEASIKAESEARGQPIDAKAEVDKFLKANQDMKPQELTQIMDGAAQHNNGIAQDLLELRDKFKIKQDLEKAPADGGKAWREFAAPLETHAAIVAEGEKIEARNETLAGAKAIMQDEINQINAQLDKNHQIDIDKFVADLATQKPELSNAVITSRARELVGSADMVNTYLDSAKEKAISKGFAEGSEGYKKEMEAANTFVTQLPDRVRAGFDPSRDLKTQTDLNRTFAGSMREIDKQLRDYAAANNLAASKVGGEQIKDVNKFVADAKAHIDTFDQISKTMSTLQVQTKDLKAKTEHFNANYTDIAREATLFKAEEALAKLRLDQLEQKPNQIRDQIKGRKYGKGAENIKMMNDRQADAAQKVADAAARNLQVEMAADGSELVAHENVNTRETSALKGSLNVEKEALSKLGISNLVDHPATQPATAPATSPAPTPAPKPAHDKLYAQNIRE